MIASCGFLDNELSQFSKEDGVTLADSVETLGVDLRTRVKRLGAKEKGGVKHAVWNSQRRDKPSTWGGWADGSAHVQMRDMLSF